MTDINATSRRVSIHQQQTAYAKWAAKRDPVEHREELLNQIAMLATGPEPSTLRAVLLEIAGECQAWVEQIDEETAR